MSAHTEFKLIMLIDCRPGDEKSDGVNKIPMSTIAAVRIGSDFHFSFFLEGRGKASFSCTITKETAEKVCDGLLLGLNREDLLAGIEAELLLIPEDKRSSFEKKLYKVLMERID